MDRRLYGTLVAAPVVAVGLYAYYLKYRTKNRLFFMLNVPIEHAVAPGRWRLVGLLVRVRNFIYRNTIQDRLWNYIEARSEVGNADSVLAAFDDYCYNYEWTWAIGDKKAVILAKVVQEAKPKMMLELGTFLGYSAIIIAQNMPPDGKLITVEAFPKSAEIARKIINRAGYGDKVTVINAFSYDVIPNLHHDYDVETLDMVFLDHFMEGYVADLKRLEKGGFLHNGSVAFADNVRGEGSKGFSEYIRSSGHYECQFYEADNGYIEGMSDGMERGIFKGADMFSGETLGL
ncbi:catechol O-methyltransferase-like [Amphiura filiformis]|uniref:catechol O-methyltransferase-like n=1 Tax=Amphiura filiformis TaxID=82378 RepID=UPI003B226A09